MDFNIVASSPTLELSGANVLVANLLDQLHGTGRQTEWVVTGHDPRNDAAWLGKRSFKLHYFPPTKVSDIRKRQALLRDFLEAHSPCVYLPNFDFDMACVAPALSPDNKVVLIMHCDDPVYHDFAARHRNLFNAIVCVSRFLADKLGALYPDLGERIVHIPFGVEPPDGLPPRARLPGQVLEVAYCGRIAFHQKRVQDLARVINQSYAEKLPVKFQIAGTGPDEEAFFESIKEPLARGTAIRLGFLPNPEVLQLLSRCDVMIMTSEFEGLPVALLEAMSRGCVPVVTRIDSGVGELVQHERNGFLLVVGEVHGFICILTKLFADPALLSQLRQAAFDRIRFGGFTLERAAADYQKLFTSLIDADSQVGRNGSAIVPEQYQIKQKISQKLKRLLGTT